jgi:PAS domain S-box-containing protein
LLLALLGAGRVAALGRKVPGSLWLPVAQAELEEVDAPRHERALWLNLVAELLLVAAGTAMAFMWRRQQAASSRRQHRAEQLHRAVLDTAVDGFALLTPEGGFVEVNDAYCELMGYSRGELRGMRVSDVEVQFTREEIQQNIVRVMEAGGQRFESRVRRKDGRVIAVEISITFLPQEGGRLVTFVRDITERKRAEKALRDSQDALARSREELQKLAASLLHAQEDERRRISRELHDDLNQRLAVLAMQVDMLTARLPLPERELRTELALLAKGLAGLSDDVRRMASQLHPSVLEHLGLAAALRSHCEQFSSREGIPIQFEERGVPAQLSPEIALCLYRIAQEALHNVARHACATLGSVTLAGGEHGLELSVTDNGAGFDPQAARTRGRLGLLSMEERARLAGGTLEIRSSPGQGTRIQVRVPAGAVG